MSVGVTKRIMSNEMMKPDGCAIEEETDFNGQTYRWRHAGGGYWRYLGAAFLSFWLCGWAFGWYDVVSELIQNKPNTPVIFLTAWLGLWTIGGIAAISFLILLLRPTRPESVTLGDTRFVYDPGSFPVDRFANPIQMQRHWQPFSLISDVMKSRKSLSISKSDMKPVVLERIGERQRLRLDYGADRIEIGENLREPEREWLASVIKTWQDK